MDVTARLVASQALAITSQDWTVLGFSNDPKVAPTSDVDTITERITSLLAIRVVAVVSNLGDFEDFSTTTLCRTILLDTNCWPEAITEEVIDELRGFVKRIVTLYTDAPYHNREHAYHVTISVAKLLDLILSSEQLRAVAQEAEFGYSVNAVSGQHHQQRLQHSRIPKTFGLRRDTLLQLALVFGAVIHDVQHEGIGNRQLSLEDDPLSLLYNDTSTLEQQSLTIGFTEFLQPEFAKLRKVLFPNRDVYLGFRKAVVNLVLATDIANPERIQLIKDKWKTAFGDVNLSENSEEKVRRESCFTEITLPRQKERGKASVRRSIGSIFSDITVEVKDQSAINAEADEGSFSATPDSSEENDDYQGICASNRSGVSGSEDGAETLSSDGMGPRPQTPDSVGAFPLGKIKEGLGAAGERNGNGEVTSQDLGYSKDAKMNGSAHHAQISRSSAAKNTRGNRRGSTTSSVPETAAGAFVARGNAFRRRRASIASGENQMKRFQRRLSASSTSGYSTGAYSTGDMVNTRKFRQRLGILRSVDLSGETIENFSRKGSMRAGGSVAGDSYSTQKCPSKYPLEEFDEPDELRATVVLETLILSADVAHNLQGWSHMVKWSHKLYWELHKANEAGRGFDPSGGWHGGQIGFLESYIMPLANKLRDCGVFGSKVGPIFGKIVQANIDRWTVHGQGVTEFTMANKDESPDPALYGDAAPKAPSEETQCLP
jgi:hypothetical protein